MKIEAPGVSGSINTVGAKIDDLTLTALSPGPRERQRPARLFPSPAPRAEYYAQFGFVGEGVKTPDAHDRVAGHGTCSRPSTPVTLSWNNGAGQVFTSSSSIDDHYMITAEQTVANTGAAPGGGKAPVALVNRTSKTASGDTWNVHSGPIGAFDGGGRVRRQLRAMSTEASDHV